MDYDNCEKLKNKLAAARKARKALALAARKAEKAEKVLEKVRLVTAKARAAEHVAWMRAEAASRRVKK